MATTTNARRRGPQPTPPSLLGGAAARHRQLARALRTASIDAERAGHLDPLSGRILRVIALRAMVPAFVLAMTRARWNELAALDFPAALAGAVQDLPSSKGSNARRVRVCPPVVLAHIRECSTKAPLLVESYDSVTAAISSALDAAGLQLPPGAHSGTHAFRHLYASWRASRGATVEEIAESLGHKSHDSTLRYIHDSASLLTPTNTQR